MVYDVRKGNRAGLKGVSVPALPKTYDDLLDAATRPERADLLLLGELNYAGRCGGGDRHSLGELCACALSFFSAYEPAGIADVSTAGAGG